MSLIYIKMKFNKWIYKSMNLDQKKLLKNQIILSIFNKIKPNKCNAQLEL